MKNKKVFFLIFIGLLNYAMMSLHIFLKREIFSASHMEEIALYLFVSWIWLGPCLIWYYEKKAFVFLKEAVAVFCESEQFEGIYKKYDIPLYKSHRWIIVLWILIVVVGYSLSREYVLQFGFYGSTDIFYILTYPLVILFAFLCALGFIGVVKSFEIIKELCKRCDLRISCYNPDKVGGLSNLIKFIKSTTYLFSGGIIMIPLLIATINRVPFPARVAVYLAIFLYSVAILMSYIVPNYIIYKKAIQSKDKQLEKISCEIDCSSFDNLNFNKYQFNRQLFLDLQKCSISPFNFKYFSSILIYGIMPVLMAIIEALISNRVSAMGL